MKRYLAVAKGMVMSFAAYRAGIFFTFIGNLLYMGLIYFLWRKIYQNDAMIHGLTFNQAFIYLALAGSIFILFKTWTEWAISRSILDGSIIVELIKPVDHQLMALAHTAGFALSNLVLITLPSALALFLFFRAEISLGIGTALFPLSLVLAFLISFTFDYTVGLTSFYTESLWGISMTKEIITSLLSGALVPLQFFPEGARRVLGLLPFQAIYHTPLTMFATPDLALNDYAKLLAVQAFWVVALFTASRLFYHRAVRVLTVSGG